MRFWSLAAALGGLAYFAGQGADAQSIQVRTTPFADKQMMMHGTADEPIGYTAFCERYPQDCLPQGPIEAEMVMTKARWKELHHVNQTVNIAIKPMSDMAQYNVIEHWTYPLSGKGDCEDYVLLKMSKLMERGWPRSVLLITVVRDEQGEGHAVLNVRTSRGDLILDNKHSRIVAWKDTPYQFIKRQSAENPRRWVSLVPAREEPTVAASGSDFNH